MRNNTLTILASSVVAVAAIAASPLKSQALTFDFQFDGTFDGTVTAPIVGTGTFSFDGDIADGTVALTSLANYNFSFDFGGNSFTNANIVTPVANVLVKIATIGSDRFVNFGGFGGPFGGSIDFFNATTGLSFQPGFGPLYFSTAGNFGTYQGIARADVTPTSVPEPGSILGLLGLSLGALVVKNKKQAQPSLSKVN